jgi:hypothetical protein
VTPEHLAELWTAWDERPGNDAAAVARVDAVNTYVGLDQAGAFHRHVTAARRHGLTLIAAIYSWGPR